MRAPSIRLLGVLAIVGCGTMEAVSPDASADGGAVRTDAGELATRTIAALTAPAEPASVALPQLTPCPSGWVEASAGNMLFCEPWAADDPVACAPGFARRPGEGCEPVGAACGTGDWADDLPTDRPVVYVRAGGGGRQDGTQAAPYRTLAAAVSAANDRDVIAVAKGSFVETLRIERAVTLHGACVSETTISGASATGEAVVVVRSPLVEVRNLTVSGGNIRGLAFRAGGGGTLEGVIVENVGGHGIRVRDNGSLILDDVLIRDIDAPSDGSLGAGLDVLGDSTIDANRLAVVRASDRGIRVEAGVDLTLTDSVIRETRPSGRTPRRARGIVITEANAVLTRVIVEDTTDYGVLVDGATARGTLRDVLIRDTWFREDDKDLGRGLQVIRGAQVEVDRVSVQRSHNMGVTVESVDGLLSGSDLMIFDSRADPAPVTRGGLGLVVWRGGRATLSRLSVERSISAGLWVAPDSSAVLEDVSISDTRPKAGEDEHGNAIAVTEGGSLQLFRADLSDSRDAAIDISGVGTSAELEDVTARVTSPQVSDNSNGVAMIVHLGAEATLRRARFDDHHEAGLMLVHEGTSTVVEDLQVSGIRNSLDQERGRGVSVQDAASLELRRAHIEGAFDVGVLAVGSQTRVLGADWSIADLRGRRSDGRLGRGVDASGGAQVTVERLTVTAGRETGIFASGEATTLEASDVTIVDTQVRACADGSCADEPAGNGASSFAAANLSMTNFVVTRSPLCGIVIGEGAAMSLAAGDVATNLIGLCSLDPAGFDVGAVQDVRFFDNTRRLDAVQVPLPDPALPGNPGEPFSF